MDAVAYLLKNDILTLEALVREMEMYLPTTDNLIHARDGLGCLALMKEKRAAWKTVQPLFILESGEQKCHHNL